MAAVTVLALTGCGGAGTGGTGTVGQVDPALQAARCMRAHGVPNFPDPGGGGPVVVPNGMNPAAPAFRSAQRACAKLLPGGAAGGAPSASARLDMFRIARCIRAHGLSSFPDPTSSPPSPQGRPSGVVLGRGGWFLVVSDSQTPAFRRAAAACHFPMPHLSAG